MGHHPVSSSGSPFDLDPPPDPPRPASPCPPPPLHPLPSPSSPTAALPLLSDRREPRPLGTCLLLREPRRPLPGPLSPSSTPCRRTTCRCSPRSSSRSPLLRTTSQPRAKALPSLGTTTPTCAATTTPISRLSPSASATTSSGTSLLGRAAGR